jgi:MFS transporter, OFA family, oxalate/formate antiporter
MSKFIGKAKYIMFGMIMNLCLGSVYSWSIFRKPVETEFTGISSLQSGLPYMLFLFFYSFSMPLGGKVIERLGPKYAALLGGFIVSCGWFVAGFAQNIYHLMFAYGIIGGVGVGILYGVPMSVAGKWFPEKKGFAVGITLAGFGLSPFITAPLSEYLISTFKVMDAFKILGVLFFIILSIFSLFMKYPSSNADNENNISSVEVHWRKMIKSSSFYSLWITFIFGTFSGLMVIGISSPFAEEVIGITSTAIFVSIFAIFNGLGRPIFGHLTDKFGTKFSLLLIFSLKTISALLLIFINSFPEHMKIIIFLFTFSMFWASFGGWLAVAPASTAKLFGKQNYVKNYGFVFTAYGIGAILGGIVSGEVKALFGSYLYIFYPVAILSAIGFIIILFSFKKSKE